jgi:cell division transport system permease protein
MSNNFDNFQKKRLRSSYLSVVVSIALVLFLVGLLGITILKTKALAQHFKEQITLHIFLKSEIEQNSITAFQKELNKKDYTKSIEYISKDDAVKIMQEETGQDFVEFLGTNPLKDVINLHVKSDFVTTNKLEKIEKELGDSPLIYEIAYDKNLIGLLNKNIQRISLWVLIFSGLLTLIAVVLINSAIRLSVYSKRFIIKTMQMVGATKSFIRRPFIWSGIKLGIVGAIIAMLALLGLSYYIENEIPEITLLKDVKILGLVFIGILLLGILITWISTFFATRRFLNLRTDQLYY